MKQTEKEFSNHILQLVSVTRKQRHFIRLLIATNLILVVCFVAGATYPSLQEPDPVDEIIFVGQGDTHWRISTIENALCFETKTKSNAIHDERKWHKVAQLYADQIHDRHAVRFDVGDFADQKQDGDRMYGVASMGIETSRMISSPYFSAIQAERADGFPFGHHHRDDMSHATLGFGGPPVAGIGGDVHGNLDFSPSLQLSEKITKKWEAHLHHRSDIGPELNLKIEDKSKSITMPDKR